MIDIDNTTNIDLLKLIQESPDIFSININKPSGILPAELIFLSLPYKDPKKTVWSREDKKKKISLLMVATDDTDKNGNIINYGIPYGGYARLILAYVISMAKIKNTPLIDFGTTIDSIYKTLGLYKGKKLTGTQLRALQQQWLRVAKCSIHLKKETEHSSGKTNHEESQMFLATNIKFWGKDNESQRYQIKLSTEFFEYIKSHANIPFSMELMPVFLESPMLMDLYLFFNSYAFWAQRNQQDKFVAFASLFNNLGSQTTLPQFKQTVKKNIIKLSKILSGQLYLQVGYKDDEEGVWIKKQSHSNVKFDNQQYPILDFIDNN